MSEGNTTIDTSRGGIGLVGVVFCILLTLKLVGVGPVANWSWWIVTSPLWGSAALVVGVLGIGAFAAVTLALWGKSPKNSDRRRGDRGRRK